LAALFITVTPFRTVFTERRRVYKQKNERGIYAAAGGARVKADAESNEVKPSQKSALAITPPISSGSIDGALVGLSVE
jgi:hypothetical protein